MALKIGQVLVNRYEIIGKIGSGGMSDVYRATDKTLNRQVAIKVLKQEFAEDTTFVARFRMEAQSAACLSNPNIVNIFDVCEQGGIHFIVMEIIEGITLKKYIERRGKLGIREATEVAMQVAYGLEAAHTEHIVHRDIKPQNIMISKEGKVFVTDFGIARATSNQTMSSNAMGSAHYISPEQARGGNCDARSDIYSLGITMYEMLTGRVPFEGDSTVAIALLHIQGEMVPPSNYEPLIPISLEKIILKCTQKKPENRYASATELISDLKKALTSPNEDFVNLNPSSGDSTSAAIAGGAVACAVAAETVASEPSSAGAVTDDTIVSGNTKFVPTEEVRKAIQAEAQNNQRKQSASQAMNIDTNKAPAKPQKIEEDDDLDLEEDDEEETEARFEKLVTYIGIGIGIVIVALLLIIGAKACNLFGSSSEETTIAEGQVNMINLIGMTYEEAEKACKDLGLNIKASYGDSENVNAGEVFMQDVKEGQVVKVGTIINVTIANGSTGIVIPSNLAGQTPQVVETTLRNAGFTNISPTQLEEASETIEKGMVVRTDPASGTSVSSETMITIIVSSGKAIKTTTVPNLIDKSESDARSALTDAKLTVGSVTYEYSNNTDEGNVMNQYTEAGSTVGEGTSVSFVVSKGKEDTTTTVPDVYGMSESKAISKLENKGFEVVVRNTHTDDPDMDGCVCDMNPDAGDEVEKGKTIRIYIGSYGNDGGDDGDDGNN